MRSTAAPSSRRMRSATSPPSVSASTSRTGAGHSAAATSAAVVVPGEPLADRKATTPTSLLPKSTAGVVSGDRRVTARLLVAAALTIGRAGPSGMSRESRVASPPADDPTSATRTAEASTTPWSRSPVSRGTRKTRTTSPARSSTAGRWEADSTTPTTREPVGAMLDDARNMDRFSIVPAGIRPVAVVPTKLLAAASLNGGRAVRGDPGYLEVGPVHLLAGLDVGPGDEHVHPVAAAVGDERAGEGAAEDEQQREGGKGRPAVPDGRGQAATTVRGQRPRRSRGGHASPPCADRGEPHPAGA